MTIAAWRAVANIFHARLLRNCPFGNRKGRGSRRCRRSSLLLLLLLVLATALVLFIICVEHLTEIDPNRSESSRYLIRIMNDYFELIRLMRNRSELTKGIIQFSTWN